MVWAKIIDILILLLISFPFNIRSKECLLKSVRYSRNPMDPIGTFLFYSCVTDPETLVNLSGKLLYCLNVNFTRDMLGLWAFKCILCKWWRSEMEEV